ncbi:Mannose-6-phosphate isomerase [Schizosaccharomyces pombe]
MYRLKCDVKSYGWGKVGHESLAAKLAEAGYGFEVDPNTPYAELWMGSHPSGPSFVMQTGKPLSELLTPETVGEKVYKKYGKQLPFLFKVLSINKVLSIQAHPDKPLGKQLHKTNPKEYKDDNHKPEMAVALTEFDALCGFRPVKQIEQFLDSIAPLREFVGEEAVRQFKGTVKQDERKALETLFNELMHKDEKRIQEFTPQLVQLAKSDANKFGGTEYGGKAFSDLIIHLNSQFPDDIGLFVTPFLNYVRLHPGEAVFLRALDPHAYVSGNIIECMAASDNVIRLGFTPKFKDIETLVNNLTYQTADAKSQLTQPVPFAKACGSGETLLYDPPIEEFSILQTKVSPGQKQCIRGINGPSILLVTEGSGILNGDKGDVASISPGFVYFISANFPLTISATSEPVVVYQAFCEI